SDTDSQETHLPGRATMKVLRRRLFYTGISASVLLLAAAQPGLAIAQTANSNAGLAGGQDSLFDAILATPNYRTPVLPDSAIATTPGLEQAVPAPQFTLNFLAPALFNSNAQFLSSGGSQTLEGSRSFASAGRASCLTHRSGSRPRPVSKPRGLSTLLAPRS